MSKPVLFDKSRWDVTRGLDYGAGDAPRGRPVKYVHHEFPPLFKNTKLLSQTDLDGRGDTAQVVKQGHYVYICHMASGGFSVVDVKDPSKPEVVKFVPVDSPHAWSIKCRVMGNILMVANDWMFFEPEKYQVHTERPNIHQRGPKEPVQSGVKIYDISNPVEPRLLSFFKTGQWSPEGGGNYCHRFWFDGHYAYLSVDMPGFYGGILLIVDVSDPKNPKEVSRLWRKGQWIAGGERPWWPDTMPGCQLHHAIVQGDRAYLPWFALGGQIVDISNIRNPTPICEFNYDMGGSSHTFLPLKERQFAAFVSEWRFSYMLDISNEKYPRVIDAFPKPPKDLQERGVGWTFGPSLHNLHENPPTEEALRSDDTIYATAGPGGLRIFDVSDPYRVKETGYYVPGTPKAYYHPYGAEGGKVGMGVDVGDVFVDRKGLIYISSSNNGLEIVESTG